MTFTLTSVDRFNMGSRNGAIIDIDVTSYTANGETIDASGLDLPGDPLYVSATPTEKNLNARWDKTNKKLLLFYPTKGHSHVAFTVEGDETADDQTAFVSITEGDGTAQTGVKVAHAGGGSEIPINTDSVGGDSTDGLGAELTAADDGGTWELFVVYKGA